MAIKTSVEIGKNNGITLKDLKDLINECNSIGLKDSTIIDLEFSDIPDITKCKSIIADEESIRFYNWNNAK